MVQSAPPPSYAYCSPRTSSEPSFQQPAQFLAAAPPPPQVHYIVQQQQPQQQQQQPQVQVHYQYAPPSPQPQILYQQQPAQYIQYQQLPQPQLAHQPQYYPVQQQQHMMMQQQQQPQMQMQMQQQQPQMQMQQPQMQQPQQQQMQQQMQRTQSQPQVVNQARPQSSVRPPSPSYHSTGLQPMQPRQAQSRAYTGQQKQFNVTFSQYTSSSKGDILTKLTRIGTIAEARGTSLTLHREIYVPKSAPFRELKENLIEINQTIDKVSVLIGIGNKDLPKDSDFQVALVQAFNAIGKLCDILKKCHRLTKPYFNSKTVRITATEVEAKVMLIRANTEMRMDIAATTSIGGDKGSAIEYQSSGVEVLHE
eukprot:TRINITY_DN921_c0_g3_i1.p1 TRINITY_DN921_c0_g3~~TRINITY_DN921_c0_g3_i1.p1  ORF type:complete len:401 (-),score=176.54 TRINITY_DN921_c0_g3_i1:88-1179(-)